MSDHLFRARRWALALAAMTSLLLVGAAVWLFMPTFFSGLRTAELAALAGLLVLPGITCAAVVADRRSRRARG